VETLHADKRAGANYIHTWHQWSEFLSDHGNDTPKGFRGHRGLGELVSR
jgi:hypothetical protein